MKQKLLALLLAILMLLPGLGGCGTQAKPLMTLDGQSISVNLYELMLSIRKGEMAYAIAASYGSADSENFWGAVIDGSSNTYDDFYTAAMLKRAQNFLCALALYEELGLSLPQSDIEAVEAEMKELVEKDGEGSKSKLNALLADFGANYEILKEYKLLTRKISRLSTELYGKNGSKLSSSVKDAYYRDNYVAFKQILLANFYYVYQTDENGDEIYYKDDGSIAYDRENGTPVPENGVFVYYNEDGTIAYDRQNGKRSPVTNQDGSHKTALYTNDQMLDRLHHALELCEIAEGESADTFEALRFAYSDEELGENYDANALNYLSTAVNYVDISSSWKTLDAVADKLAEMEIGELAILQTDAGIHILRKYPLESGAYENDAYSQWFTDSTYLIYDFNANLVNELLSERLSPYAERVTLDESLLKDLSLKRVKPNYYYY